MVTASLSLLIGGIGIAFFLAPVYNWAMPIRTDRYYTSYTGETIEPTQDAPYRLIINADNPRMGGRTIYIPDWISDSVETTDYSSYGYCLDLTYHLGMKPDGTFPIVPGVYTQRKPRISRIGLWTPTTRGSVVWGDTKALAIEVLRGSNWETVGVSDNALKYADNMLLEWTFNGEYDDVVIDGANTSADNGLLGAFSDSNGRSIIRIRLCNPVNHSFLPYNSFRLSCASREQNDSYSGVFTMENMSQERSTPLIPRGFIQVSGQLSPDDGQYGEIDHLSTPKLTSKQLEKLFALLNDDTEIEETVTISTELPST